jgi:hypothetical protein
MDETLTGSEVMSKASLLNISVDLCNAVNVGRKVRRVAGRSKSVAPGKTVRIADRYNAVREETARPIRDLEDKGCTRTWTDG